jgi:hypothetical protein
MDWTRLEKDINDNTALLLKQKSKLKNSQGLHDRSMISFNPDSNVSMLDGSVNVSVVEPARSVAGTDMDTDYLRMIVTKQQQQINNMEKSIFALQSDHRNKENNPYASEQHAVQQTLMTRLVTVEETAREINDKYASKDALLQLLNAVMDQLRECNRCIDACSSQSASVSQFSDAFLHALVEVSNGHGAASTVGGDINRSSNRKRTALSLNLLLGLGA